jgi:PAS domain S-box-containing protein
MPSTFKASFYPFPGADGTVSGISAVMQDVTERTHAEEQLRRSQQRTQKILDSMYAFVAVLSTEAIVQAVNRAPLDASGLAATDVIGRSFETLDAFSYAPEVRERLRAAIRSGDQGHVVRYDEEILIRDQHRGKTLCEGQDAFHVEFLEQVEVPVDIEQRELLAQPVILVGGIRFDLYTRQGRPTERAQ